MDGRLPVMKQDGVFERINLSSHFTAKQDTNTAIQELATAMQQDPHLPRIATEMCNGYRQVSGVALA
jgi:Tfp pilus assembly protein PilF